MADALTKLHAVDAAILWQILQTGQDWRSLHPDGSLPAADAAAIDLATRAGLIEQRIEMVLRPSRPVPGQAGQQLRIRLRFHGGHGEAIRRVLREQSPPEWSTVNGQPVAWAVRLTAEGENARRDIEAQQPGPVLMHCRGLDAANPRPCEARGDVRVEFSQIETADAQHGEHTARPGQAAAPIAQAAAQASVGDIQVTNHVDLAPIAEVLKQLAGHAEPKAPADKPREDQGNQNEAHPAHPNALFPKGPPDDPDLRDLALEIDSAFNDIEAKKTTKRKIALKFTNGNKETADKLLTKLRGLLQKGRLSRLPRETAHPGAP